MRFRVALAGTAVLVAGLFGLTAPAAGQESVQSRLTVVHALEDEPPLTVLVDGEVAIANLGFGGSAGPETLTVRTHTVELAYTDAVSEDGDVADVDVLFTDELTAVAGFAYTYTAAPGDGGDPVVTLTSAPFGPTGALVFRNDIAGGAPLRLALQPGGVAEQEVSDFLGDDNETVAENWQFTISNIPQGTHALVIRDESGTTTLATTDVTITAGGETLILASDLLGGGASPTPTPSPAATSGSGPRTPTRIDTGAGGSVLGLGR
jgi:hypothetical protein